MSEITALNAMWITVQDVLMEWYIYTL